MFQYDQVQSASPNDQREELIGLPLFGCGLFARSNYVGSNDILARWEGQRIGVSMYGVAAAWVWWTEYDSKRVRGMIASEIDWLIDKLN